MQSRPATPFGGDVSMRHRPGRQFVCFWHWFGLPPWPGPVNPPPKAKARRQKQRNRRQGHGTGRQGQNVPSPRMPRNRPPRRRLPTRSRKGRWKITVDLEGVFEAQTDHEIVVKPDEWNSLVVLSAVAARRPGSQGRRAADVGDRKARPRDRRPPRRIETLRGRHPAGRGPVAGAGKDARRWTWKPASARRAWPRKIGSTSSTWSGPSR